MNIITADWSGFAVYILNRVLKNETVVHLSIDDIKIGAHSDAPNIRQHWWWSADDNRAHPQFGSFFHRFVEVSTFPESGQVQEVAFKAKYNSLFGVVLKWLWLFRGVFVNRLKQEDRGWEQFEEYLQDMLEKSEEHQCELSVESISAATRTMTDKLKRGTWWNGIDKDAKVHLNHLLERHMVVIPMAETVDQQVKKVLFRLSDNTADNAVQSQ